MHEPARTQISLAAFFAFTAVLFGAFGAHALEETLAAHGMTETWKTAVLYHLVHAIALLAVGVWGTTSKSAAPGPWTVRFFSGGIVLFSGSLYGLALGGPSLLGPITPLGGLCFLAGWVTVFCAARRQAK